MLTAERTSPEEAALAAVLEKFPDARRDVLIPVLQETQQALGYLSQDALQIIARHLHLPTSKVFGVATFYNQFRFTPPGRCHVQVCRGTACHVKGSASVLDAAEKVLGVKPEQTTRDGAFSLEVVGCMGVCGLAPLVCVDGDFQGDMSADKMREMLQEYRERGTEDEHA